MSSYQPSPEQVESIVQYGLEMAFESRRVFDEIEDQQKRIQYYDNLTPTFSHSGLKEAYKDHLEDLKKDFDRFSTIAGFLIGPGSIGGDVLSSEVVPTK